MERTRKLAGQWLVRFRVQVHFVSCRMLKWEKSVGKEVEGEVGAGASDHIKWTAQNASTAGPRFKNRTSSAKGVVTPTMTYCSLSR